MGSEVAKKVKYLESYLELGGSLWVPGGLIGVSLDVHGHGEDGSVHRARLGQQAVLEAWVDLIETHQSVHGMVGIHHPPIQNWNRTRWCLNWVLGGLNANIRFSQLKPPPRQTPTAIKEKIGSLYDGCLSCSWIGQRLFWRLKPILNSIFLKVLNCKRGN